MMSGCTRKKHIFDHATLIKVKGQILECGKNFPVLKVNNSKKVKIPPLIREMFKRGDNKVPVGKPNMKTN